MECLICSFFVVTFYFAIFELYEADAKSFKTKVIFINTVNKKCTDRNYAAMIFYHEITKRYFDLYGISYTVSKASCYGKSDTSSKLENDIKSHDLLIIMTDATGSFKILTHQDAWGFYTKIGGKDLIVSNSLSPFTTSKSAAWTLSHELSHFILNQKQYPTSVYVDWVHNQQDQVNDCKSKTSFDYYYGSVSKCPTSLYDIIYINNKKYPVMKVYNPSSSADSHDTRTYLSLDSLPSYVYEGEPVTFSGYLENYEGLPISDAMIYIKDEDTGSGDEILESTETDSNGHFAVTWYAEDTDTWDDTVEVYAVFEGSSNFIKSKTRIQHLYIEE